MLSILVRLQTWLHQCQALDFLAPLCLRIYLFVPFWQAGNRKFQNFDDIVSWFGNPDWGLGLPAPELMAAMATSAELIGSVCLLVGLAVRWATIPLMIVMIVAALTVHISHGWLAIASADFESAQRLGGFLSWLSENFPGRHEYITELGKPVILNNGIEFAATYFIMLLTLFFIGGGRWVSIDHWLGKAFMRS